MCLQFITVILSNSAVGITKKSKNLIDKLIEEQDGKPNRILILLSQPKYESLIDVLPSLSQIQCYMKYRRIVNGDTNDIDAFVKYENNLKYSEKTDPYELFCFGAIYGDGSSGNHFQIGFFSEKLLRSVNDFKNQGFIYLFLK